MAPDANETDEGMDRQEVSETRIALTFFGGVSLAVYETGAAVEFFRLVTGDGVYKKLCNKIGRRIVVDIISGTSAGALSAAFLATALINRSRSLDPLMQLWLDKADLDTLFHTETEEEPTSLLNGERFLALINKALQEMARSGMASAGQHQYLDLFLTATSLEGDVREFQFERNNIDPQPSVESAIRKSEPNHINARSHQRVFHFRYRGDECAIDEERHNDFQPQRLHLIARAARASASFPVAFEPVLIKKDEFGSFSRDLVADCHYIDGGILDNKPIKLAFDAIGHRQADKQIDRRLFYVEPLPEEINFAAGAAQATPLAGKKAGYLRPINVLYAAVKDLPSYQSITSALEEIVLRNHELETLRRTLTHYETLAAKTGNKDPKSGGMARSPRMWGPAAATASSYHPAKDIPTQLFRAQEDGYLDLRLERHFAPWFAECEKIGSEIQRRSEEDDPGYLGTHEQFYYLKQNILWSCDFEYHRRQYHYLKQVVRGLFARLEKGEKHIFEGVPDLRHEIYLSLNRLRALFNKQERQIYLMQQHAQRNPAPELLPIEGFLAKLRADLEGMEKGKAKEGVALISTRVREMAGWAEIRQRWRFLAQLHQTAEAQLKMESTRFLKEDVKKANKGIQGELQKGYVALDAALHGFYYRDMIIYPMMRGSEMLASELQPIRVARFGPLDAHSYVNVSHPNHKMAGEEGLRFGGFMDATWRGNDLIWGRLDAVENIFHQLLPKGREDELFKTCVRAEQKRIVQEMKEKFGKGIVHPLEKQDPKGEPPHEDLLIGKQNLCDIPAEKKIRWLKLGTSRLVRTIRVPRGRFSRLGWKWTQAGIPRFFDAVVVRPKPAAFLLLGACAAIIVGVSFLGACALRSNWGHPHPLLGWTGDMVAVFWLLFVAFISLIIATIANFIRIRLLKIHPPSKEDKSESM